METKVVKRNILVKGPVFSRSGYGEQCRFALRALRSREDLFNIFVMPITWGSSSWQHEETEERRWLDHLVIKTNEWLHNPEKRTFGIFDIALQITIPNEWEKIGAKNIGYTAGIETTSVAPQWVEKSRLVDHIITISNHSKNVYKNSSFSMVSPTTGRTIDSDMKCTTPITVVHYPVRELEDTALDFELDYDFNFLTVAQWGPRKDLPNTIKWFVEEFIDQEVGLVVKTFQGNNSTPDKFNCKLQLESLLEPYKNRKCKVYLIHGTMSDEEMNALYKHPKIKAYTTLTHGEGFGLPIFEAAYNGVPVIAPDWSGHIDYLYMPEKNKKGRRFKQKPKFCKVDYDLVKVPNEVVWEGVIIPECGWAQAKQGSYKMQLRSVYKDFNKHSKDAKQLQAWILENFTQEKQYKEFVEVILKDSVYDSNTQIDDGFTFEMIEG